jgi:hypothetical protein
MDQHSSPEPSMDHLAATATQVLHAHTRIGDDTRPGRCAAGCGPWPCVPSQVAALDLEAVRS